ncbi:hypothetical protein FB446DRAFT_771409 [Lentinula raphanica]|nr:hypothetical protein FB446DRAFT_771409 [Lentinula raphanica]
MAKGKISAGIKLAEVTESLSSWSLHTQQYVASSRYIISEPTTHLTFEARPILILMALHYLWIYTSFQPCIFSLKAQEARCRTRYLDLIISKAILHDLVFTEVKTRITSLLAGGDTAEPFIAHQNDLNVNSISAVLKKLDPTLALFWISTKFSGSSPRLWIDYFCPMNEGLYPFYCMKYLPT